ncbi:hypothetical protein [Ruthenibacterium lactatiformans]|uniref:hypothetical protein n=1 Tax=Ruthenibacterium lactatiformans TaxID=1550024 RepID=UPI002675615B|nr:hypothetical protein [Ruthenibacterium lactatiformans]
MKKADGWSMGQEEQKKKALEEKLRRRVYTAAFEAAQQRKEKPWQSWDEAFSERLAKQPFITEEERKPFAPSGVGAQNAFYTGEKQPWPGLGEAWPGQARRAERPPWAAQPENLPDGAGAQNAFYTGEKQPWPGLGEAWPGQARRAERTPWAALPENLPDGAGAQNAFYTGEKQPWPGLGEAWPGQARRAERTPWAALPENPPSGAGTMLLAGQRRSMAQAAPGGEPPAGPEQGAPGFALEGVDPAYRDAVYAGQALAELLRPERRKEGAETGKALQPGGGYGTLKKRQDTESWRDAFLEQQAALQAQTLAQERAQAEGVGAAYTKYVRPLLERAALGLSTALSPIPSVPGSEPGTGLAQAIETSNANYERNKMHDISGRPVHGQGVDAAGEFAYGNSQMKDSGCGVIGTYNALYLLGKDPSLAEVGRRYEISGAMAGGGAWGTNPYGAPQVLKQYGVQYEEYTDPDALEREAGEGDVMIVSIWNRKGTIFEGYHTFAVQKVNGELMVYNRFNNSAESTEKKTMGEVIENGQFIVGYRVQNAK